MVSDVDELLGLASRLMERGEPDCEHLLMKVAGYDHRLLFAAADKAERDRVSGWGDIRTMFSDAAVEALRTIDEPSTGINSTDNGHIRAGVTVSLAFVRWRSERVNESFYEALMSVTRMVLSIANMRETWDLLVDELDVANANGASVEDRVEVMARYVNIVD